MVDAVSVVLEAASTTGATGVLVEVVVPTASEGIESPPDADEDAMIGVLGMTGLTLDWPAVARSAES